MARVVRMRSSDPLRRPSERVSQRSKSGCHAGLPSQPICEVVMAVGTSARQSEAIMRAREAVVARTSVVKFTAEAYTMRSNEYTLSECIDLFHVLGHHPDFHASVSGRADHVPCPA